MVDIKQNMFLAKVMVKRAVAQRALPLVVGGGGARVVPLQRPRAMFPVARAFSAGGALDKSKQNVAEKVINNPKLMSAKELRDRRWPVIVQDFARFPGDTGSPEVQAALLTERIRYLTDHFKVHKKDKHSLRGLRHILNKRQKMLLFLRRKDAPRYFELVKKLGLKDKLSERLL